MARDAFIDRLRGYACLLVVFGHVIMGIRLADIPIPDFFHHLETFIWSFHVPLFLFISGAVYALTGGWTGKGTRLKFIGNKAISLGVPYIIFSVVYIVINALSQSANTQSSISDVMGIFTEPVAQYWYLYALFFLFVIWALLGKLRNWQITIIVVALAYGVPLLGGTFGFFEFVMYSSLAFGVGTCVKISDINRGHPLFKIGAVLVHILLGAVLIKFKLSDMLGVKEALMLVGIYCSILFISLISKWGLVARFLDFINKYSFQTYLLHTIFTAGCRTLLVKIGVTQWYIHIIVGCILGITCSILAAIIARKTKIFDLAFFPLKKLKRSDNK